MDTIVGILAHRTSEDDWGVQSPPQRKVFRFHETILSFGEPGSLGKVRFEIFGTILVSKRFVANKKFGISFLIYGIR